MVYIAACDVLNSTILIRELLQIFLWAGSDLISSSLTHTSLNVWAIILVRTIRAYNNNNIFRYFRDLL